MENKTFIFTYQIKLGGRAKNNITITAKHEAQALLKFVNQTKKTKEHIVAIKKIS